jgi:autotransporter-associated beta strand protein
MLPANVMSARNTPGNDSSSGKQPKGRLPRWIGMTLVAAAAFLWWQQPRLSTSQAEHPSPVPAGRKSAPAKGNLDNKPEPQPDNKIAETAPRPVRPDVTRPLRQDLRWKMPVTEPAFAGFREWTDRFSQAGTPDEKAALVSEGLALAEERRNQMADLIDQNPRRALELAVPVTLRRQLPEEIVAQLEESVSGRGDLFVMAAVAAPGKPLRVRPVERQVVMTDGREFEAFTFGQRDQVPTRENIAVQGIALDGKLALTELPGRMMEPVEVADLRAAGAGDPECPTSGEVTSSTGDEVVVDWDGSSQTFFCGEKHAVDTLIAASGDELFGGSGGVTAQSTATEGPKKLLIIRVDFPDAAGQVVSDATLTSLINNMSSHWATMSFGKMSWATHGNGSDFTPTLRLPNGHASYTSFGTMLSAARSAATAAGFNYTNYTHEVVVTGDKPDVGFGGIAFVGARGAWLANGQWNLGVCSHEVGHNFGLNHSGFWDTDDGTTIGSGSAVEYGNPFDQMGGASSSTDAHFGARQKNYLDWLVDADVVKITANGSSTTRIRAFDKSTAAGDKAIAVDRTGTGNDYWIEYRQTYTDTNKWMKDGVVLNWGDVNISNMKPVLLDWTPGTSSKDDCPVLIGRTFSDPAAGIHITPVLRGADPDGVAWIDVTVNRGSFTGNRKPTVAVTSTNVNPAANASVTFTADASDPDADTLGYFWDWGDGTFTANNSATASKSWSTTGTKTVRCHVTDMKGMTTTGQLLVQVGTSSTFFIQGVVTTTLGVPVENAVVRASSTKTDTTDSEGYFAITGLAAGSYTLTATKTGLTIQPDVAFFTNPVAVGPNKQNINFTAPPGTPYFATMKAGSLDAGSNTGAVIIPVSDADTPVTSLTFTGTSSNTAIIPNASITFGTIGTTVRTVSVAAGASVSGPVDITLTATDPEGGTASYVYPVTVNSKPVLSNLTGKSAVENTPLDIDLRTLVADDLTVDDKIAFELSRARNGSVSLLADGRTARFTPAPDYHGAASFQVVARDQSLSSRMLFLYDFEPPDVATDAKVSDLGNNNRFGGLESVGTGGEYAYASGVPGLLSPYATKSISLTEASTGAARIRKTLATTDLNYNDADWSVSTWFKRVSRDTNDIIFHLGTGDGFGPEPALQLYLPANSDTLKVGKYGAAGLEKEAVGPAIPVGTWHHVTLTYDRTATNLGTLALFVDGFAYGTVASVAMDVSQTTPLYFGGAASSTTGLDAWFDGQLEDVTLQSGLSGRPEMWGMARTGTQHYHGLSATGSVTINVAGANQAPSVTAIPDVILPVGAPSAPVSFQLSDAETEARNLTVTAATSNATLLPLSGITLSAAPAAWSNSDIGTVGAGGSLIQDHGTFIVAGAGADIGAATGDEFRWVRQDFSGNAEMVVRVASMDFTHTDGKAGVMMRDSSTTTSPYALVAVTPGSGVTFQYRATESTAAVVKATLNGVAAPCWLRLVRSGSNFTAFYATDSGGTAGPWQAVGAAQTITFPAATNSIGLAVTSKVDATLCTTVFDRLGGTVKLGGERTVSLTPTAGASGSAVVTLTAGDGTTTTTRTFNVLVDGAPPSTSAWNATAAGSLLWSTGTNWSGGTPPPDSRFSTIEYFTGQTFAAGAITSTNDTALGHAMNVLTLGGTGPTTGTTTVTLGGNPLLFRQETTLAPTVNLSATNGTGLTYNITAPVTLDAPTTFQGSGTATFRISSAVTGAGGLTKTGTSRLILAGANSYLGTTTISGGTLQFGLDGATGTMPPGNVINNATLRFDRTGTLLVPNPISGSGSLYIDCPINAGTIVLTGSNSFTGGVNVNSGALRINNSSALGNGTKTITLSNGTSGSPQLRLDGSGGPIDLPDTIRFSTSNVNGAIINEAGNNILRGNFTLTNGGGDTRIIVSAGTLTLEGDMAPNTTARTLQLSGAGTGFATGIISNGSATNIPAVTKNDAGTWTVSGANTYSGTTTVSAGTLKTGHPRALGDSTGATSVSAGARLDLNGQAGVVENITLAGGTLANESATAASLASGVATLALTAGGTHATVPTVTFTGSGSGAAATATLGVTAASFTITGGTTVYSAAPTVAISGGGGTGATATAVLTGGIVSGITITKAGTGFTTAPAIAFSGGTVTTAGTNPSGTGNATNFTVSALTLTATGSGYPTTPAVTFGSGTGTSATAQLSSALLTAASSIGGAGNLTVSSAISGAFALEKTGTGTVILAGANTPSATTINAGRLALSGSLSGPVTMNGGILQGTGAIVGNVTVGGGFHAPGNSAGIMTITGNYSLPPAGTLQVEVNGTAAGTQYDQVKVQGAASVITLAGSLDLIAAPALASGGTFVLIDNAGTSPVAGTFANLPQATEFYEDGQWWRISYTAGTGNDVVLTRITPTPWQNWQVANFGANINNPAVSGDAADGDHDGLTNLLEYALGGNPQLAATAPLPEPKLSGGKLALTFTRTLANTDLTLTVQAGDSLAGPWTNLARSSSGAAFTGLVGGVGITESGTGATRNVEIRDPFLITDPARPRRFLRLSVTRP